MSQLTTHNRSTSTITLRTILSEQRVITTSSADIIRARSSTLHAHNSTNASSKEIRTSARLDHIENEMSSSMHVTKTTTLLAPPSNDMELKPKSSPWFWRRRYTSRTSLVRSASTNKANEDGSSQWMGNGSNERPSGDEAYDSKTSTLSSAITIDGVSAAVKNKPVARSASSRDTKPGGGGFLRFLRASFASRPKRSQEVKPGSPPLSMTQSGLSSLAGKQANIARVFADPNNRLSTQISQFPDVGKTYSSVESFNSEASRESLSTSKDSHQSSLCYSNDKPPPVANRNSVRSQSAHTRPIKTQPELPPSISGRQGVTSIYSNDLDECSSMEIIRQPPILSGINSNTSTPQRTVCTPVGISQTAPISDYYANAFENGFQMIGPTCPPAPNPAHYFQAYLPQSHFNATFSDGQIYDQPPPPTPTETNKQITRNGNHHQKPSQRLYEGISYRMIPPMPPATAPASRKRFGRSNYESGDLSFDDTEEDDDDVENGKGGTLSRRKPVPPMGILVNQYSRESLHFVSIC